MELRGEKVLLDVDVAVLYGVETKRINEAVKNNADKFPAGYIMDVDAEEFRGLRSKFSTAKFAKTRVLPKAFTEKGLYMMATILKSKRATTATFAIIETYAKLRQLNRNLQELPRASDESEQKSLMHRSGELMSGLFDDGLRARDTETSIELNFAVLKFKHTVKKSQEGRSKGGEHSAKS